MDNGEARFEGRKGIELRFASSPMMCDDDDFFATAQKAFCSLLCRLSS